MYFFKAAMSINIILFNTDAYHPGQTVEGKVVCIFNSDMNIRGNIFFILTNLIDCIILRYKAEVDR